MKLAIDCRMLNCSGIGTFLKGILPYMIQNIEHQYFLIGDSLILQQYEQKNCFIIDFIASPFSLKELFFFPIKEVNLCDGFFSPNYNIPLGINIPIYSTIHDVLFLDIPSLKGHIGRFIRKLAIKRVIEISHHIFTVSEFSKSRILYHCPNAKGISVCYNGADNIEKDYSEKNNKVINEPYFLFIGNIKPHKGLNILLDAFDKIPNTGNKKLVIVGSQEHFLTSDKQVSKRIQESSLRKDIVFTGYVDQKRLINLISNAYCLIQPSIYEGFGLPPLEAMHLGTPVILSDIPVFKELFFDFPVFFFKSGDSESLAKRLTEEYSKICLSQPQIEKFTYKKTANIILNQISSCLQK